MLQRIVDRIYVPSVIALFVGIVMLILSCSLKTSITIDQQTLSVWQITHFEIEPGQSLDGVMISYHAKQYNYEDLSGKEFFHRKDLVAANIAKPEIGFASAPAGLNQRQVLGLPLHHPEAIRLRARPASDFISAQRQSERDHYYSSLLAGLAVLLALPFALISLIEWYQKYTKRSKRRLARTG